MAIPPDVAKKPSTRAWFLSSRVARRIFILFVLCALLPLVLFARLALDNVTEQLEVQAQARLHEECKAVGMSIVERLAHLQTDVRVAFRGDGPGQTRSLESLDELLRERLDARFAWIAIGSAESTLLEGTRTDIELPQLSDEALTHLARERALISFCPGPEGSTEIVLVIVLEEEPAVRYAFAAVRREHLWNTDSILRPDNELVALSDEGDVLFATGSSSRFLEAVSRSLEAGSPNGHFEWEGEGTAHVASYRTVFTRPQLLRSFVLAESRSRALVEAPVEAFEKMFVLFSLLALLGVVLASLIQIRRSLVPIGLLAAATERVRARDFSARVEIESRDEFRDLGSSFNEMTHSLERYVGTMHALHEVGVALTAEQDSQKLIGKVAAGTLRVTAADAVLIHLVEGDDGMHVAHISKRSVGGETRCESRPDSTTSALAERAAASDRTLATEDEASLGGPDGPYAALEAELGLAVRSAVCVPLRDHEGETTGVLELLYTADPGSGIVTPHSEEDRKTAESLASQAAVALNKNKLVDDFRNLFEALTELIATAIDEKSKYTGDHCRRVPVLTMMIADEVCKDERGAFAGFDFTPEQLYELKVAALLHDCGKVVTPVHVVDKATKLETIFDRIELVSTRFEIVRRDVEIERLRDLLARDRNDAGALGVLEQELSEEASALRHDLDFLRETNVGGEFMPPEVQERVRTIASSHRWVDGTGDERPLLTDEEVENLSISRGTLTAAEREEINYHVVATINMLEKLPYPKHLARVPEIAGAHHERMDGKGYPLGLERGQIALQGRILGIADVFEALTAKDRPYKPGKTLSETLEILGHMKQSGHVDPDLFRLFVESGVFLRYAQEFLDPNQIDQVDLAAVPGFSAAAPDRRSDARRAG